MHVSLTVTAKGQVTLKREVLRHLGVRPGQKIEIDLLPAQRAEIRAANPKGGLEAFFGILPSPDRLVSIDEMNEAIERGWADLAR